MIIRNTSLKRWIRLRFWNLVLPVIWYIWFWGTAYLCASSYLFGTSRWNLGGSIYRRADEIRSNGQVCNSPTSIGTIMFRTWVFILLNMALIATDIRYLAKDTLKNPETLTTTISLLIFKVLAVILLAAVYFYQPSLFKKVFTSVLIVVTLIFLLVFLFFFRSISGGGWAG